MKNPGPMGALLVAALGVVVVGVLITVLQLSGAGMNADLADAFRLLTAALLAAIAVERVAKNGN